MGGGCSAGERKKKDLGAVPARAAAELGLPFSVLCETPVRVCPPAVKSTHQPLSTCGIAVNIRHSIVVVRPGDVETAVPRKATRVWSHPLSSEYGTHKIVKTGFWPYLSGKTHSNL